MVGEAETGPGPSLGNTSPGAPAESAGLRWTWHPLVDMGIATLVALAGRSRPEEVAAVDLQRFAEQAERALYVPAVRSHASVLFTINVPYLQPSFPPERRAANARALLHSFAASSPAADSPCVYCGRPALHLGTETGRAYRELVPLLTGQGTVNFAPYGQHGLALCGLCLTALQALVLGAPNCEGRALIVGADDPSQLVALLREWLPALQTRVQLSEVSGARVDPWKGPRTRLIERLVALARRGQASQAPSGFTVYHATNSGQGPDLAIYSLTAPVVTFVKLAQATRYRRAWARLEARSWLDAKRKAADRDPTDDEQPFWQNRFYEALFRLPEGARGFVAGHFVRPELGALRADGQSEHVALWDLAELFLEEVLGVEQPRIEAIRNLADALAEEITQNNDLPLLNRLLRVERYVHARNALLLVSRRRLQRGRAPILSFEGFLQVFEVGEETERRDWRLAWDLMLVRLIDRVHPWLAVHQEAARELADVAEASAEEPELLPAGAVA